jgi:WD40 repeat protein
VTLDPRLERLAYQQGTRFRVWNLHAGREELCLQVGKKPTREVVFSHDGQLLAVPDEEAVLVQDLAGPPAEPYRVEFPGPAFVDFSSDDRFLALAARGRVRVLEWKTKTIIASLDLAKAIKWLAIATDGKQVLIYSEVNTRVERWDLSEKKSLFDRKCTARPLLSPDGKQLVVPHSYFDGTLKRMMNKVQLLNAVTGEDLGEFGSNREFYPRCFSPDGQLLLSVSTSWAENPSAVWELWDMKTRSPSRTLPVTVGGWQARFSRDGKHIVWLERHRLRLIPLPPEK